MKTPKPNANQWFAIALILALCYNGYIHATHPAYTYYKENVQALRREFIAFRNLVQSDFVPAVSNGFINLAHVSISNQVELIRRDFKYSSVPFSSQSSTNTFNKIPFLRFHSPCHISGRDYVFLGSTMFGVGE